jgi:hypothetical protein
MSAARPGSDKGEVLGVLREVWRTTGQDAAQAGAPGDEDREEGKTCRRMADAGVGFDGFGEDAPGEESPGNVADLAAAWRARLRREGKYNAGGGSVRDLIMGSRLSE